MSAVTSVPAAAQAPSTVSSTIWSRLSDRLNPILVREVQQAVKGRVFPLTILLALAISVIIAGVVASDYADGGTGRSAFDAGFATLAPLLLFIIPMQAFNSMRTELKGGIVEQLLLSRLSPGSVLSGKLQAAMVQFVLYVSVMSPLLATSYLLRGVDLVTIAISLLFAFIACVTATAFAVSSAAQSVVPALQPIANLGVAFGLGMGTFAAVGFVGSGGYVRAVGALLRSGDVTQVLSGIVLLSFLSTMLSWLAARTFLLHAFENKSTAFRIFIMTLPVWAYGWMLLFVDSTNWRFAFPALTSVLFVAGILFGVFMVTEQQRLSPRVWAHVPANAMRARLLAPLLPGRDRGLLCFVIYMAVLVVMVLVVAPMVGSLLTGSSRSSTWRLVNRVGVMALGYTMLYLSMGRWLRGRLPDTVQGNHAGRFVLPLILVVFCVAPALVDVVARGDVDRWHVGHIMNPFWTIEQFVGRRWPSVRVFAYGGLALITVLQIPVWLRGLREIRDASAQHRERLAANVTAAAATDAPGQQLAGSPPPLPPTDAATPRA